MLAANLQPLILGDAGDPLSAALSPVPTVLTPGDAGEAEHHGTAASGTALSSSS